MINLAGYHTSVCTSIKRSADILPHAADTETTITDLAMMGTQKTNDIIRENKGEPYRWEYYNPVINRHYLITDRIIRWPDGREVRFELAIDITDQKRAEDELKSYADKMDEIIAKKTATLQKTIDLMSGREVRMMELKKVIKLLRAQIEEIGMVPVADDPLKK
jgi:hypothetical protein